MQLWQLDIVGDEARNDDYADRPRLRMRRPATTPATAGGGRELVTPADHSGSAPPPCWGRTRMASSRVGSTGQEGANARCASGARHGGLGTPKGVFRSSADANAASVGLSVATEEIREVARGSA